MNKKLFWLVVCVVLSGVTSARATTYSVNNTPGNVLGVTGFIATDGITGSLGSGDISDWSLTIPAIGSGVTFTLNKSNSLLALGSNLLSATSTTLSFNFSNSTFSSLSFENVALMYSVIWTSGTSFGGGVGGIEEIGDGSCALCFANSPPFFGTVIIGTAPVPAALPLFATGLGVLGMLGWRRKRKTAVLTTD